MITTSVNLLLKQMKKLYYITDKNPNLILLDILKNAINTHVKSSVSVSYL